MFYKFHNKVHILTLLYLNENFLVYYLHLHNLNIINYLYLKKIFDNNLKYCKNQTNLSPCIQNLIIIITLNT